MNIEFDEKEKTRPLSNIHIRIRHGKKKNKWITTVEGLASDLDLRKIAKYLRKTFKTSGSVLKTEQFGDIIQLYGDQRDNIKEFFIKYKIWDYPDPKITIHGF